MRLSFALAAVALGLAACAIPPSELRSRPPRAEAALPMNPQDAAACMTAAVGEVWHGSNAASSTIASDGRAAEVQITNMGGIFGLVSIEQSDVGSRAAVWVVNDWIGGVLDNDKAARDVLAYCGATAT